MWSFALYDLRLTPKLFWRLTPRQYDLLVQRHRAELVHREMCHAFTTAAVVNHSFSPPEKWIPPSHWMPHHSVAKASPSEPLTADQLDCKLATDGEISSLGTEMKTYAETGVIGPALKELGYGKNK